MTYEELLKLLSKPRWLITQESLFLMGEEFICRYCYRGFTHSCALDIEFEEVPCPVRDKLLMQWSRMGSAQLSARR